MAYRVTLIPGDGIGPEVSEAAQRVIEATGVAIEWDVCSAGMEAIVNEGEPLPARTLESLINTRLGLKGPLTTPIGKGFRSVNVELRKKLDLFANYRPAKSLPGVPSRYEDVDLIVVRENTEGMYCGFEHMVTDGVAESLRIITRAATARIARFAFETARSQNRRRVTIVHKANILKLGDGLFLDTARQVAQEFTDIECNDCIVDAAAMKLVIDPSQFDVLVMENLFGDIISDLTSGLTGGLGLAASANLGTGAALFEAVHGSAPDIAGLGMANPTALIRSGAMLLAHVGETEAADAIERAVCEVLAEGRQTTRDLGGSASTSQYTQAVIDALVLTPAVR